MPDANFAPLYENSHDIFAAGDVGMSFSESDCHKYRITTSNQCTIEGIGATPDAYLDAQFLRPEIRYITESQPNRKGEVKRFLVRKETIHRLELMVNDFMFIYLTDVGLNDTISIYPINPDGPEFKVDPASWQVDPTGEDDQDTYAVQIQFKVIDSDIIAKSCCEDESIVSFEDPCDIGGGGGGMPEDPCEDYVVDISYDGNSLTADVTGGPTGATITYQWYLDNGNGVFTPISTAQALNPVTPGIYRVVATRGTCQQSSDYDFSGDCLDFEVTIIEKAGPILIASANRFSTYKWYKDTGGGFVEIGGETTACLVPDETADYKVEATSNSCTAEDTESVTVTVCAHSVSIARVLNVLESTVTGNTGAPTYQWYVDYGLGAGTVLISGATSPNLAVTEPGCYEVKVTADGCDKYAKYVVLDVCVGFDVLIDSVTPDGGVGVDITAMAINPPDTVNYIWYQVVNGVFQQIGTGTSVNTSGTGTVKVVATSGACTAEDITSFCVDPGSLENYQSQYGDGGTEYEITIFTLPNPATYTNNEINAMLLVFRNGVKMEFTDDLSSIAAAYRRTYFEIDFANNEIELDAGFPLKTTEKLEALLVNTP